MEHPFVGSLADKTMEELQTALAGLATKMNYACRIGNRPLINQLNMVIESYRIEHARQLNKKMEEFTKASQEQSGNPINISNDR